ncbi:MAG: OmpA family protein [Alphaproteobacteria bacterium]|nr:OmpA family protein [Alphaproteobacteria bacterium]
MTRLNTKIITLTGLALAGLVLAGCYDMTTADSGCRPDCREVVRDRQGHIVHSSNGNCVRTQWMTDHDACASQYVAQETVRERRTELTKEERTVYFAFDRAALSSESRKRLSTLANTLKSDQSVKEARIVGYADRIGSTSYNEKLSKKRAQAVRDYLVANGYTNARVTETRWVGESEPATNCPAEARSQLIECLQSDRRVEVEIEYIQE